MPLWSFTRSYSWQAEIFLTFVHSHNFFKGCKFQIRKFLDTWGQKQRSGGMSAEYNVHFPKKQFFFRGSDLYSPGISCNFRRFPEPPEVRQPWFLFAQFNDT